MRRTLPPNLKNSSAILYKPLFITFILSADEVQTILGISEIMQIMLKDQCGFAYTSCTYNSYEAIVPIYPFKEISFIRQFFYFSNKG